jgi:two-component system chemotaxis response regulator CheY
MEKTALLLSNTPGVRAVIVQVLLRKGFQVLNANDESETFHHLHANDIELIVMEGLIYTKEGIALSKEIKNRKEYRKLPVIVVETESTQFNPKEAKKLGITASLSRSFILSNLSPIIDKAVELSPFAKILKAVTGHQHAKKAARAEAKDHKEEIASIISKREMMLRHLSDTNEKYLTLTQQLLSQRVEKARLMKTE